jgi:hypothetical protein
MSVTLRETFFESNDSMCLIQGFRRHVPVLACLVSMAALAGPAAAQTPAATATDPNPGSMTLAGSFDVMSKYMFRGIRQHSTGIAFWPVADLDLPYTPGTAGSRA